MKRTITLVLLFFSVLYGAYFWWETTTQIQSSNAEIEGTTLLLSPEFPNPVAEIFIPPGTRVIQGQHLYRLDDTIYHKTIVELQQKVTLIDESLPPVLVQVAYRARKDTLEAQIAFSRKKENTARQQMELHSTHQAAAAVQVARWKNKAPLNAAEQRKLAEALQLLAVAQDNFTQAKEEYESLSSARAALEYLERSSKGGQGVNDGAYKALALHARLLAAIDAAKAALAACMISAPSDGVVHKHALKLGETAYPGQHGFIFLPADDSHVWATAFFTPSQAARLQTGQPCTLTPANGSAAFEGRVVAVGMASAAVQPPTPGLTPVRIAFASMLPADHTFPALGENVTVRVSTAGRGR